MYIEKDHLSFVHFHLRTMHSEENYKLNYIRLDSGNTEMEQSNTNSNFWVHLRDSMKLNENSEVALVNINFPNKIKNINSSLGHIEFFVKQESKDVKYSVKIPATYYSSATSIIQTLKSKLPNKLKELLDFNLTNDKLQIDSKHDTTIRCRFPMKLIHVFGINTDTSFYKLMDIKKNYVDVLIKKDRKYVAPNPINVMYYNPDVMLCYTNFVKHSIVGNSYFPILKIIPIEKPSDDDYISVHFDHLEFIKTNVEYLKDLHFEFRHLNGDFIEFVDNKKIILNLVVKKN